MSENFCIKRLSIIALCCLLVLVHMGYGDDIKNKEMFNRVAELVINQQSSLIVGTVGRSDEPRGIWLWSLEDGRLKDVIKITEPLIKDYEYSPSYTRFGIEREGLSSKVEYVKRIAISHDGKLIAVSFFTLTVGCYSLEDKKWLWTVKWLNGERHSPEELRFTPDDKKLITAGEKNIVIYDSKTGDILERQTDPLSDYDYIIMSPTTRAVLSSSGRYLVTWHIYPVAYGVLRRLFMNKNVTVWDVEGNKLAAQWKKPKQRLRSAVFTPDEKYIVFSSEEGFLSEWSISEQKMLREWQVGGWLDVGYLTFSPDGRFFAFEISGNIRIWDYPAGKLIYEDSNKEAGVGMSGVDVYPMAFSPDSKYFALEKNGQLCLYETETWKEKWYVPSYFEEKQNQ